MSSLFKKCRHPYVSFFYFFASVCLCIAVKNPLFTGASFFCALLMNILLKNRSALKKFAILFPFFVVLSCFNPLVSHWGNTVLFNLLGDSSKPITLEAFCYGLNTAFTLLTVVMWFFAFACVITSDKLTFIFGRFFPSVSIMLVMILRLIPFYKRRSNDITMGRRGMALEKGTGLYHQLVEKMHVLSAVTSSTLEDGSFTAKSMEMRGWKSGRRTCFIYYKWGLADFALGFLGAILLGISFFAIVKGGGQVSFYPEIDLGNIKEDFWSALGFCSNTILMALCALFCR